MSDCLNPIAELNSPDSGKIITPEEAYNLKDEQSFFCPDHECKDPKRKLNPKKSSLGNYFFSHNPNYSHDIYPETLLHKMAIKWFIDQDNYELPEHKSLNNIFIRELDKEKTKPEFRLLQKIIPDVRLSTSDNFEFAIEIVVTNDVTISKEKLIKEFKLPTIRVDLQDFYETNKTDCRTNVKFIQDNLQLLLTDIKRKSWVIPPDFNEPTTTNNMGSDNTGCLLFLVGLLFFFYKWWKD
jgi:hypothetical protein